jgi:two-component system LytT family response regulator
MKKAIIVDDEPLARMVIKEYLLQHPSIQVMQECNEPDVIFLDIQMPKINGFEMLELIEQPPAVIFTTAFDEFAIKAFESHAVDYLLKPFSQERFDKAIERLTEREAAVTAGNTRDLLEAASQAPQQNQRIVVKTGNKIKIIPVDEVHYLEAADDYVKIHTKEGAFLKNKTMGHFEKILNAQQFVRTHRSYIVNVQLVTRIDPYEKESYLALLTTGAQVPVSKTGYAKLKSVLGI